MKKAPEYQLRGSQNVHAVLGPVFAYEWLTTTRRWQLYALRVLFVGAILIGMIVVWNNTNRYTTRPGLSRFRH